MPRLKTSRSADAVCSFRFFSFACCFSNLASSFPTSLTFRMRSSVASTMTSCSFLLALISDWMRSTFTWSLASMPFMMSLMSSRSCSATICVSRDAWSCCTITFAVEPWPAFGPPWSCSICSSSCSASLFCLASRAWAASSVAFSCSISCLCCRCRSATTSSSWACLADNGRVLPSEKYWLHSACSCWKPLLLWLPTPEPWLPERSPELEELCPPLLSYIRRWSSEMRPVLRLSSELLL
mmetsp:Transcript_4787/g.14029  ORF Transcript_4787/g.14029 Transcript_4787/m.14029 type:complete len:239 (-) Transcript_4787:595-1311(-)